MSRDRHVPGGTSEVAFRTPPAYQVPAPGAPRRPAGPRLLWGREMGGEGSELVKGRLAQDRAASVLAVLSSQPHAAEDSCARGLIARGSPGENWGGDARRGEGAMLASTRSPAASRVVLACVPGVLGGNPDNGRCGRRCPAVVGIISWGGRGGGRASGKAPLFYFVIPAPLLGLRASLLPPANATHPPRHLADESVAFGT